MTLEHQPILVLADSGWFSLIILLLFALSSLLTSKKKKKQFAEEDDNDDFFDTFEIEHPPPPIRDRAAALQRVIEPPSAIPTLIRAVESLSNAPSPRRAVPARKSVRSKVRRKAVQPARRNKNLPIKAKPPIRLAAGRLASASPNELRNALVISEILAPPVALREDPTTARDLRGAI